MAFSTPETDPFAISAEEELGSYLHAYITRLNASRLDILHKKRLDEQLLADPDSEEVVPNNLEEFTSQIIDRALTDYFDAQPDASEITRSGLLNTGSKTPLELFE